MKLSIIKKKYEFIIRTVIVYNIYNISFYPLTNVNFHFRPLVENDLSAVGYICIHVFPGRRRIYNIII